MVYDLHKSGMENTDLVDACLKEIDILLEKYWELSAQIDDYRNVVKCPACGASNPAQASYCIRCGYQIGSEE